MQIRNGLAISSSEQPGGSSPEPAAVPFEAQWDPSRWASLLDRIDVRLCDVGLKFWGPPLWLEVTMTGPDSDQWPAVSSQQHSWNWQSSEACTTVTEMINGGAGDVALLEVAGRYTLENLVLNAVHEIGEWLRFDGERLFHSHAPVDPALKPSSDQGNGTVEIGFSYARSEAGERQADDLADSSTPQEPIAGLRASSADRFTYLPEVIITFTAYGPLIESATRTATPGAPSLAVEAVPAPLGVAWSQRTLQAVELDEEAGLRAAARDVHRALVAYEAQRICSALYVDSVTQWHLDGVSEADTAATSPKAASVLIEPGLRRSSNASASTTGLRISVAYNGDA